MVRDMKTRLFIVAMIFMLPLSLQAQSDYSQHTEILPPLPGTNQKIYRLRETDLSGYQLPRNYMIVKNSSQDKVVFIEFPNDFTKPQAAQEISPLPEIEKTKAGAGQKLPSTSEQLSKAMEKAGLEPGRLATLGELTDVLKKQKINP